MKTTRSCSSWRLLFVHYSLKLPLHYWSLCCDKGATTQNTWREEVWWSIDNVFFTNMATVKCLLTQIIRCKCLKINVLHFQNNFAEWVNEEELIRFTINWFRRLGAYNTTQERRQLEQCELFRAQLFFKCGFEQIPSATIILSYFNFHY